MALARGARATAVIRHAGIPALLFRALPASSHLVTLPVLCRSRSRSSVSSNSVAFAILSSLSLSDSRGRFGVVFCAPSSSAVSSVSVDSRVLEAPAPAAADVGADLDLLDIRVGKILKAWKHPEADSLYVEEVDVGEPEGSRTICSGIVKYVPQETLEGRAVVVLANLKARNMRGVKSNGMLLCASDAAHENVELLSPPEGAAPGERIWFGLEEDQATQKAAAAPNQVQKKKIWESIQPLLKTTDDCAAVFQDKPMRVSTGIVTCASLKNGNRLCSQYSQVALYESLSNPLEHCNRAGDRNDCTPRLNMRYDSFNAYFGTSNDPELMQVFQQTEFVGIQTSNL